MVADAVNIGVRCCCLKTTGRICDDNDNCIEKSGDIPVIREFSENIYHDPQRNWAAPGLFPVLEWPCCCNPGLMMKIERSLRELDVLALELESPLVLASTSTVADVIVEMRERGLGYALFETEGRLAGIFTERDAFLSVLGNDSVLVQPVSRFMTSNPSRVYAQDPVWRVVLMMHSGGYRQVPVVDSDDRILACVRHKDIASYLVNHFAAHVLNLPPDPEQVARTPEGG